MILRWFTFLSYINLLKTKFITWHEIQYNTDKKFDILINNNNSDDAMIEQFYLWFTCKMYTWFEWKCIKRNHIYLINKYISKIKCWLDVISCSFDEEEGANIWQCMRYPCSRNKFRNIFFVCFSLKYR